MLLFKIDYKTLITVLQRRLSVYMHTLLFMTTYHVWIMITLRRGKPSTHIKFGESTAVLAGNSLLTMAFEILTSTNLK